MFHAIFLYKFCICALKCNILPWLPEIVLMTSTTSTVAMYVIDSENKKDFLFVVLFVFFLVSALFSYITFTLIFLASFSIMLRSKRDFHLNFCLYT